MPINPKYPGVYIQELPSAVRTIVGVSTSITAFIGRAIKGPTDAPRLIHSFTDYERIYGGLWRYSEMSYAVYQFYQNGGNDALIVRVHNDGGLETFSTFNIIHDTFKIKAANPGQWSKDLVLTISWPYDGDIPELVSEEKVTLPVTADQTTNMTLFNLEVKEKISDTQIIVLEKFLNLSTKDASPRFVTRVLEAESEFVRAEINVNSQDQSPGRPDVSDYNLGDSGNNIGSDGDQLSNELIIAALSRLDNVDLFNLLCIPPYNSTESTPFTVYDAALQYIENNQKRAIVLIDPPVTWRLTDEVTSLLLSTDPALNDLKPPRNKNSAMYFPRIKSGDPLDENKIREFVPCGAVAGIIARTDSDRGVWKSPAGIEASINGASNLTVNLTDSQNGDLNPLGINCLRVMGIAGIVIWGARTLRGADQLADQWKYLAVRRTALYIEESLYRGTQWVVFEPNDEPLWAQIRLNITAFMQDLFLKGAFQGSSPKEAYLVRCDHDTTTQLDIDRGIVNIVVGFAPLKPAEFVILQIKQLAGLTAGGGGIVVRIGSIQC